MNNSWKFVVATVFKSSNFNHSKKAKNSEFFLPKLKLN
jgi:hypothetical protein